jgi:hypothetical protein
MADSKSTSTKMRLSSYDRVCGQCGGSFKSRYRVKRRFCSNDCEYKYKAGIGPDGLRHRVCRQCNEPFTYKFSRGNDRWYCSDFCRTKRRFAHSKTLPLCVFPGCQNRRGTYKTGICNSCYWRIKRTGTIERRAWAYRSLSSHGYVVLSNKTHPLTNPAGRLYEHRMVLYDAIGKGPHPCHWCGTSVDWIKGKCFKGSLVPDHLDGVKSNNAVSNLVPACNHCNTNRGLFMSWVRRHKDDPVLWQMYNEAQAHQT